MTNKRFFRYRVFIEEIRSVSVKLCRVIGLEIGKCTTYVVSAFVEK